MIARVESRSTLTRRPARGKRTEAKIRNTRAWQLFSQRPASVTPGSSLPRLPLRCSLELAELVAAFLHPAKP